MRPPACLLVGGLVAHCWPRLHAYYNGGILAGAVSEYDDFDSTDFMSYED